MWEAAGGYIQLTLLYTAYIEEKRLLAIKK